MSNLSDLSPWSCQYNLNSNFPKEFSILLFYSFMAILTVETAVT